MSKRRTPQRDAIARVLRGSERFQTAQEVHDELRSHGERVGLATVYRTLQDLADAERVDVLQTRNGGVAYRLCASERHHHHLVCTSCGTSVEIESPAVERWANDAARKHGFTHDAHTAEVYGTCAPCRGPG